MDGIVSIGRNVGDVPMREVDWLRFVKAIHGAVTRETGGKVYATAYGKGQWNGVEEDTALVSFRIEQECCLHSKLQEIAREFKQEAIALMEAEQQLITA